MYDDSEVNIVGCICTSPDQRDVKGPRDDRPFSTSSTLRFVIQVTGKNVVQGRYCRNREGVLIRSLTMWNIERSRLFREEEERTTT